jgi:hypothetical protein
MVAVGEGMPSLSDTVCTIYLLLANKAASCEHDGSAGLANAETGVSAADPSRAAVKTVSLLFPYRCIAISLWGCTPLCGLFRPTPSAFAVNEPLAQTHYQNAFAL